MTKYDAETVAIYNAKAAEYDGLENLGEANILLEAFISALPVNGTVLDLGCGPANVSAQMVERGLQVTAIDPSIEMAALAKRKHGLDVSIGTFDDVIQVAEFDGIWASFSLLHAPRSDMPRHLAAIHRALKPRGIFYIGMKTGEGERRDPLGRKYTYYTEVELAGLLSDAGFIITDTETGESSGLDGVVAPWVIVRTHA